jgi:hypothetical protein
MMGHDDNGEEAMKTYIHHREKDARDRVREAVLADIAKAS